MYILKKIVTSFGLPPGLFIIILMLYSFRCFVNNRFRRGIFFLILGATAWALSISPVSDALLRPLESNFGVPENPKGDVIIVLGAGVNTTMPDFSGKGSPSMRTLYRMLTALRLQKKLNIPLIISGRGNISNDNPSKLVLNRYLNDLGVPPSKIIIEDKSMNTLENAKLSAAICKEYGYENPILVTSAYHLKRAVYCFRMEGLSVMPFPAGFETWKGKQYAWISYLPDNFRKASLAIYEYIGLVLYWWAHWK